VTSSQVLELAVAALLAAGGWLTWARFWPFKSCWACRGHLKRGPGSSKWGYSRCWKCGGSGEQTRWTATLISKVTGWKIRGKK